MWEELSMCAGIIIGNWLKKILTDMKNKINTGGNVTFEDMKLFLYSAVSILC